MPNPILYLGDTSLSGAAGYLAGIMTHWGYGFDYVASCDKLDADLVDCPRRLFVLSDYPAVMMDEQIQEKVIKQVADGAGLLMIGGWESFHGKDGHWNDTLIASALPVHIASQDDRVNYDQLALVVKQQDHPITQNLPWSDRPPSIGGFNQIEPKPNQTVLLEVQRFKVKITQGNTGIVPKLVNPLLVTGTHHQGHTAALATDLAPHWVGPMVDWGDQRVTAQAQGAGQVEVGSAYAQFVRQLLAWTGRLDEAS